VSLKDFLRQLLDKHGDPNVLRGQRGDLGGRERELLKLQEVDVGGRTLLSGFEAPEGAAERLAQTIAAPDFWVQMLAQNDRVKSSARRPAKLSLNFEVVGHERTEPTARATNEKGKAPREKSRKTKPKRKRKKR